jgi:ABC-type bacteriocin/lantibiotic exporter with double-glycine peptidase domain
MRSLQMLNKETLDILDKSKSENFKESFSEKILLKNFIKLNNVSFSYNDNKNQILKNINLEIKKGSKVGIKGTTGSGKSTLGNILISLLNPTQGQLYIDDVLINHQNKLAWQKNIAIVPQNVFLNDVSIAENIAIGIEPKDIDLEKVRKFAKLAQINNFIEKNSNQYNEKVGERGVKLSGGQRQRIGIARALYREAKLIVFDEATNQLDEETENLIMQSINNFDSEITVVFITHRLSTLKYCDQIIDLDKF